MPGFCLCLNSAYAWILPMPGFPLCLDFPYAWILPMLEFCLCLEFPYAWNSPMPGFCLCLNSAYAWILPMPGFCLCLDSAYAWNSPMPGFCLWLYFAMPGFCLFLVACFGLCFQANAFDRQTTQNMCYWCAITCKQCVLDPCCRDLWMAHRPTTDMQQTDDGPCSYRYVSLT